MIRHRFDENAMIVAYASAVQMNIGMVLEKVMSNWLHILRGLDRESGKTRPVYLQIESLLSRAIDTNVLAIGARLPANRELSEILDIDRSTVARAYAKLEEGGYIESHVGKGTFVKAKQIAEQSQLEQDADLLWSDKFSAMSRSSYSFWSKILPLARSTEDLISFASGVPSEDFYPFDGLLKTLEELIHNSSAQNIFSYCPYNGHPELREQLKLRLSKQGLNFNDKELLVLSGSQQGISIVADTLVDPGDVVFIEEPTYTLAASVLEAKQARCLSVPSDEDGLNIEVLESLLLRHKAKLLYLIPTFQNPSGSVMSMQRRVKLIELAYKYQLPILEDNFVGDLNYDGVNLPSLRALDTRRNAVIHLSTFSKALCPALRLGWLIGPAALVERLQLAKRANDLSTNSPSQAIMAEFLKQGLYDSHLDWIRHCYRQRRDTMAGALRDHFGTSLSFKLPSGGMSIWVRLPKGFSSRQLLRFCEAEGVVFNPGDLFFLNGQGQEFMKLAFVQQSPELIEKGIARLKLGFSKYEASLLRQKAVSLNGRQQVMEPILT